MATAPSPTVSKAGPRPAYAATIRTTRKIVAKGNRSPSIRIEREADGQSPGARRRPAPPIPHQGGEGRGSHGDRSSQAPGEGEGERHNFSDSGVPWRPMISVPESECAPCFREDADLECFLDGPTTSRQDQGTGSRPSCLINIDMLIESASKRLAIVKH